MGAKSWVDGSHHKVLDVTLPEATYGSCKNFKRCGNTEAVLKQRDEMLGNGYCMQCYDKGIDSRRPRLTKLAVAERKEMVIEKLNNGVHYKEIAKELNMAPSSTWLYIKRLEEREEVVLAKDVVKEEPTYGRPSKAKILPFANAKKIYERKGKVGDKVTVLYKDKAYGKFSREHAGHNAKISKAENRIAKSALTVKFMYLVKCTDCKKSEAKWVYSRSFEKKND